MRNKTKEKEIKNIQTGKEKTLLFVDDIFYRENPKETPKNLLELTSSMR